MNLMSCNGGRRGDPPYPKAPRLGQRPLTNSAVNSFGWGFVWLLKPWIAHPAAWPPRHGRSALGYRPPAPESIITVDQNPTME